MFEVHFQDANLWQRQPHTPNTPVAPRLLPAEVASILHLRWAEHCVECAVPECYKLCPLYVRRRDGECSRFVYGIYPNGKFSGHYTFGADITFRRWGKIQAELNVTSRTLSLGAENIFRRLPGRAQMALAKGAEIFRGRTLDFDEFVVECHSPEAEPFNLILEHYDGKQNRKTVFRHSFAVQRGHNFFSLPFSKFALGEHQGYILLYPEGDQVRRLIFTWLDFVKYHQRPVRELPAGQVKCVAWDLDNTLWQGILAETGDPALLTVRPEALQLIRDLDERGIIQTVVSKNTHAEAWKVVESLGLSEYFIYPAINWGAKSQNLRQVAEQINIGIDSFALIDDSSFERAEVGEFLPQVRVYSEMEIAGLLARPEFAVPITDASRMRRHSYLANMKRTELQAQFDGSYEDFLISCGMNMKIFEPREENDLLRSWELLQRSNQLNISNRRYEYEEFKTKLGERSLVGIAFSCRDKFGDYGLVGFATLQPPALVDFVMSCRVAQKGVERTLFIWLAEQLKGKGFSELSARFVVSKKNTPMRTAFEGLPFRALGENDEHVDFKMELALTPPQAQVIALEFGALPVELSTSSATALQI